MKKYVFDSSALISFFEGDYRAKRVINILKEVRDKEYGCFISIINLGEIYYHFLKAVDLYTAEFYINEIHKLNFEIIDADWELTKMAATYKSKHKMSYADTFAAGLCKKLNGILITSDKEIKVHFL
jgi:predicted nucleic acid-binding protein